MCIYHIPVQCVYYPYYIQYEVIHIGDIYSTCVYIVYISTTHDYTVLIHLHMCTHTHIDTCMTHLHIHVLCDYVVTYTVPIPTQSPHTSIYIYCMQVYIGHIYVRIYGTYMYYSMQSYTVSVSTQVCQSVCRCLRQYIGESVSTRLHTVYDMSYVVICSHYTPTQSGVCTQVSPSVCRCVHIGVYI